MLTIWKFPVPITDEFTLDIPRPATVLSFGLDPAGVPCVWCVVDPAEPKTECTFALLGTGNPDHDGVGLLPFVGSVTHGRFVWHLFRVMDRHASP